MRISNWLNRPKAGVKAYIAAFCLTVFLAVVLLAAAAFLPQYLIQTHIVESMDLVYRDFRDGFAFDWSEASRMDVLTDVMMLRASLATNDRYLGSILTNPFYTYEGMTEWVDVADLLASQAYDMPADDVWFYSRYWMGFRVLLRMALTVLNYGQIKRCLGVVFFTLFLAVVCSMAKQTDSKMAFLFAMSMVLIRPYVIATSMQYTSCFLIAFPAMLLVPWLHRHPGYQGLFFLEIGMLTMYFDFYTVPLITMGFPLIYLLILKQRDGERLSVRMLLGNMAAWFGGYVLMWFAKLVLTTLLTSENALLHGLQSFAGRVGIRKDAELEQFYSLDFAMERLQEAIFSDELGKVIYLLCAGIILAVVLYRVLRGRIRLQCLRDNLPFLVLALLPLVWFLITKQPIAIHAFFQYRTIVLTHWASGIFLYQLLTSRTRELATV